MQKFLREVDLTSKKIQQSQKDLKEMNHLTRKVSGAAEEKEAKELRQSLEELRSDFIQNMAEVKDKITQIKKDLSASTEHEKHVKQQQIRSLVERTKKAIEEFSTVQSEFSAEERERLKSQYIIAKPTASKEELEAVEYSESPNIPFLNQKTQTDDRKNSVKNISKGIKRVMKMTEELNLLVHEKDRDIDKISIETDKAEVKAKKIDNDLKAAERYQKWARLGRIAFYSTIVFLIIAAIVVFFGGFIFMIFIMLSRLKSDDSDGPSTSSTSGNSTQTAQPPQGIGNQIEQGIENAIGIGNPTVT